MGYGPWEEKKYLLQLLAYIMPMFTDHSTMKRNQVKDAGFHWFNQFVMINNRAVKKVFYDESNE